VTVGEYPNFHVNLNDGLRWRDEQIAALTARLREQATMLRRLEWSQRDFDSAAMEPVDACPVCRNWQERGHAPDCELAALLAALPGAAGEEGE
jgi:hypothetical protein